MGEEKTIYEAKPEMVRFEISRNQLVGKEWQAPSGGMVQDILLANGWLLSRPAEKLHETENGRIVFFMAKNKRDGSVNEVTLKRSVKTDEVGKDGKAAYQQEKMTVSIGELSKIVEYGAEKYRYQKEEEAGFITMTVHKDQLGRTWKNEGKEDAKEYTSVRIGGGYSFLKETEKIRAVANDANYFRISLPLRNAEGGEYKVNISKARWTEKDEFDGYETMQLAAREVRKRSDAYRDQIADMAQQQEECQKEGEKEEQEERKEQQKAEEQKEEEQEQAAPKRQRRKAR